MVQNDFDDEFKEDDALGVLTDEEDLLFSIEPGPRIINLNNASGTTLLGIVLEETEDSFLVGLPSRLLDVNGEIKVEPYMPISQARFLKSSIMSIAFLFGVFLEKYIDYLKTTGKEIAPEIVNSIDLDTESNGIEEDEEELVSSEELEEKVKTAQSLGGLILNGSLAKH